MFRSSLASGGCWLPWLVVTLLQSLPLFSQHICFGLFVCVCLLISTFVVVFRSHLDNLAQSPHLRILNYICKKLFFQRKHSQVLEFRMWTCLFLGITVGPITASKDKPSCENPCKSPPDSMRSEPHLHGESFLTIATVLGV